MATAVRNIIELIQGDRPIYAPGPLNRWTEGNVTVVSTSDTMATGLVTYLSHAGQATFAALSMSRGSEVTQLTDYFLTNIVRSMEGLADPYANVAGEDPFAYRSVPKRQVQTIHATGRWIGPAQPRPITDD
ncbi:MAG: hypothetical protein ACLPKB_03195 [Xanthobacteraceae bacterium]